MPDKAARVPGPGEAGAVAPGGGKRSVPHLKLGWDAEDETARLAAIVASSPDAMVSFAAEDGRIMTWNAAAERLFGYTEAEAVGAPVGLLVPEGCLDGPDGVFTRAMRGEPINLETVRRHRSGTLVDVAITASRMHARDGRVLGISTIFRDLGDRRRAEEALRAAEANAWLAIDAARLGSWDYRPDTGEFVGDARCRALFGLAPDAAMTYDAFIAGMHPEDRARMHAAVLRAIDPSGPGEVAQECRTLGLGDAGVRWLETLGRAYFDKGRCVRFTGVVKDVTDRKRLEEALRESEAKFRAIADSMPQLVWSTRPDGYHDYFNQRWYDYVGRRPDETEGEGWNPQFHPDDQDRAWTTWRRSLETGEPYEIEYRLRRHDGVHQWFLGRALPVRDEAGRIVRWFGTCTNIDEQKRNEIERGRLTEVVEQSPDFIAYADPAGKAIYINPEGRRMVGLPDLEAVRRTGVRDYFLPEDLAFVESSILPAVQEAGHWSGEFRLRRFDTGEAVPVDYRLFTTHDAVGRHTGLATVCRDISERKHAEEARQLLVRELNHRVKNLFAIASGMVMMTARTAASPQDMAEALFGRLRALAQAHELIRPAVTAEAQGPESTALSDLVTAVIAPHLAGGTDQLRLDGPPVELGAHASTSLALVLHELATNAAKYGALSARQGRLEIRWTVEGDRLALTWREADGPRLVGPPQRQGFGSQLARMSVKGQLGGTIDYDWAETGVCVTLTAPLERLRL